MAPLLGADGETYAIAQGNIVVGGLGVTGADNSSLTVNIPTVGRIPRGASVERIVPTEFLNTDFVILNLHRGDFSTANNVAQVINDNFGADTAIPLDTNSIRVRAPNDPAQKVSFVSVLENLEVDRGAPPAKIIVNSRTGTLVISGNVKVTPAAVSHGTLSVRVNEDQNIDGGDAIAIGEGAQANAGAAVTPRPPTTMFPCAIAYVSPSAPNSGAINNVPPFRDSAPPIVETVTSIACPGFVNGGKSAVIITAAALSPFKPSTSDVTPNLDTRDCID